MSKVSELQTLCEPHKTKISIVCFYKGCTQTLLCRNCWRNHPQEHEHEIKDLIYMIDENSWVESIERQKRLELGRMEEIYQQKKEIMTENEHLLNEFVKSIIAIIEAQKQIWLKELNESMSFSDQQEREIDGGIALLRNLDFSDDIFERIQKVKSFNDNVLPNVRQLVVNFQSNLKKWQLDKDKIEGYKGEITEIIQKIGIKSMLTDEPFRSLSEEQIALEREYKDFKNATNIQLRSLSHKNEDLKKENIRLQNELNQMIQANTYLEKDYENETADLKSQIANLEKLIKISILGPESSKIIRPTNFNKLKEWIPKPSHSTTTRLLLLYRASRDGWSAESFHAKCDGISPTILAIKSQHYEKVFGGYTTKNWGLNAGHVEDKDAFIFSLTHGEKYSCNDPSYAIYTTTQYIVGFGGGAGNDIFIYGDYSAACDFPSSYTCSRFSCPSMASQAHLAGAHAFKVEELEVYHVMFFCSLLSQMIII